MPSEWISLKRNGQDHLVILSCLRNSFTLCLLMQGQLYFFKWSTSMWQKLVIIVSRWCTVSPFLLIKQTTLINVLKQLCVLFQILSHTLNFKEAKCILNDMNHFTVRFDCHFILILYFFCKVRLAC